MRTKLIRYGRLRSFKEEFGHAKLEKEVELDPGDDEETALTALRADIEGQLGLEVDYDNLRTRYERLKGGVERAEAKSRQIREEHDALYHAIDQATAFIAAAQQAGIEVPKALAEISDEHVPF